MEYSYKFRLYPTATQQEQMARNFGCCRYVFNHFLAQRHEQYRENGKAPTRFQQDKSLTALKQELPWLKEVDSTSLQAALQDLDTAYQNFFRRMKQGEKPGYPRFKSKHNHRQSYKSKCVGTNIKVLDHAVWKTGGHDRPLLSVQPALLCMWCSVARNERPFCAGVVLPGLRYSPRPGHQRREEHPQRRSAPAGVDRIYGRAGHARTDTLGETM